MPETISANTAGRIEVIQNVQRYLLPLKTIDYERLASSEEYVHESVPTIGAEIEIPWSARFPQYSGAVFSNRTYKDMSADERLQFSLLCDELDDRYLPMYEAVTRLGVPRDKNQKFWEFAHSPVRHHATLATEINLLAEGGLLPEGFNLPLHVTIGGLSGGSGAYFVQMLAEISGASNASRIREPIGDMPIYNRKWARKAPNGLKERRGFELRGASCGFEMRTFVFNSSKQVVETLRTCQLLSLALGQKRRSIVGEQVITDLVDLWHEAVACVKLAEFAGVSVSQNWQGPASDPEIWTKYADLLTEGGAHEDIRRIMVSRGVRIVSAIAEVAAENSILYIPDDKV